VEREGSADRGGTKGRPLDSMGPRRRLRGDSPLRRLARPSARIRLPDLRRGHAPRHRRQQSRELKTGAAPMPSVSFDRFYRYAELTAVLRAFAAEHRDLVTLESIGKSHEGRDLWLATVTNAKTGPAHEKPAFWVDGNIHSVEVSASAACLYLLHTLTAQYGKDADVTRALDTRAFYIIPRINPDGAECALADKPKDIRSSTRTYPYEEAPIEGMTVEDVDGDGRILSMRMPDANGLWKKHPDDARLMVRRDPTETGGEYYR